MAMDGKAALDAALDEGMAYRACMPWLAEDMPDVMRPPGYGYLWNPAAGLLVDEWETDDGRGCEVAIWEGATPGRAAACPAPWPEHLMAGGEPLVFSPGMAERRAGELARALEAPGWLRAYPRESAGLAMEPPGGASTFQAALSASTALSGLSDSLGGLPARGAVGRPRGDAELLWEHTWWAALEYGLSHGAGWPDLDLRLVSAEPGEAGWCAVRMADGQAERRPFALESCALDWAQAPDRASREAAERADLLAAAALGPAPAAPQRPSGAFAAALAGAGTLYSPSLGVMLDFARMEGDGGPVDMAVKFGVEPGGLAARLREGAGGDLEVYDVARLEPGCDVDVPEGSRDMGLFAALVARDEAGWLSGRAEIERALLGVPAAEAAAGEAPAPEREAGAVAGWVRGAASRYLAGAGAGPQGEAAVRAFAEWLASGRDAPEPPGGLALAEEQGAYAPVYLDALSVLEVLGAEGAAGVDPARALDEALAALAPAGGPAPRARDVLEAWSDAASLRDDVVEAVEAQLPAALSRLGVDAAALGAALGGTGRAEGPAAEAGGGSRRPDERSVEDMRVELTPEQARALRGLAAGEPGADPGALAALDAALAAPARRNPGWEPVEVLGTTAILHNPSDRVTPYVAADGYDPETNEWGAGQYRGTLLEAYQAAHGAHLIDVARGDVVAWSVLTHEDVREMLEARGAEADEGLVERIADEAAGPVGDLMCERGWDALSEAVDGALSRREGDGPERPEPAPAHPGPGPAESAGAEGAQGAPEGGGRWFFRSDDYVGLSDEEASELLGLEEVEPAISLYRELSELRDEVMDEECYSIDRVLDAELAVRGAVSRWDGVTGGFAGPFPSMRALLLDTGRGGVFQDCEIDAVWDEGGALMARGVHHDGSVTVEVRPVTEALAEALAAGDVGAIREAWDAAPAARAWERLFGGCGGRGGGPGPLDEPARCLDEPPDPSPAVVGGVDEGEDEGACL